MRLFKRVLTAATLTGATLYALVLVGFAIGWSFAPTATWWIALTNVFAAWLFLPALALVPLALALRSRWLAGAAVVSGVTFVLLFGGLFLPRLRLGAPAGRDLRVATFNQLYYGEQPEKIVAAILAQDADIVAIQELHTSVAEALQRDQSQLYPYQYLSPSERGGGLGVVSRYPLLGLQPLDGRDAVIVDVGGQAVTVVNVHIHFSGISKVRSQRFFGLPYLRMYDMQGRLAQVEGLLNVLLPVTGPVIVMGDFNTGDREPGYAAMRAQFHDVYRETSSGFGYTFPYQRRIGPVTVPVPMVRIDYIWTRGPITPLSSAVNCVEGSDHCMIVAALRLTAPE